VTDIIQQAILEISGLFINSTRKFSKQLKITRNKLDPFNDNGYNTNFKQEKEQSAFIKGRDISPRLNTLKNLYGNYKLLCAEILKIQKQNSSVHFSKKINEVWAQMISECVFEEALQGINEIITSQSEEYLRIEKLLENLSGMILSNQKSGVIDQEACNLIQKLFGDRILVKILKHIDINKGKQKTPNRRNNRAKGTNLNKNLMALRN